MDTQLALFSQPIVKVSGRGSILERFARFHHANPHVYDAIVVLARRLKDAGARRIGMKQIFEVLRYERRIVTRSDDGHKLNNDFTPLYARMVRDREADLCAMFETRSRRAA